MHEERPFYRFEGRQIISVELTTNPETLQITARLPEGAVEWIRGCDAAFMSIGFKPPAVDDLVAIKDRWRLARLAGIHAEEAGWDAATSAAMTRSWADIPALIKGIERMRREL